MLDVLLVDDEPTIRLTVGDTLRAAGHQVTTAADGGEALSQLGQHVYDLVISDIRMPKLDGMSLFQRLRSDQPNTDVILITAYGDVGDAVAALKRGAFDYLTKPFDSDELALRVSRLDDHRKLRSELRRARALRDDSGPESAIIGRSPPMVRLMERVRTIAPTDAPVIVVGESGTGKELIARTLHALSPRANASFVAVNCAAFPETLLEAELFGHAKGAFTGALRERQGRFQAAHGGTLFLDEIAEIPPMAQVKLLRVLQEGTIEPLGTNAPLQVDVRIISATHRDLKQRIGDGVFREDLYYRLNVLDIHVPPVRDRRGDLPLLAQRFLERFAKTPTTVLPRAWAALSAYPFPGNVRELEHAIQHAVVLASGKDIDLHHLPADIVGAADLRGDTGDEVSEADFRPLAEAAKAFEREYLLRTLAAAKGKRGRAADLLGISRKNLWEKLRSHGITDADLED